MGYSYLVLGTGMGRAIAHCLANQPDTSLIVIGDVDTQKAREVAGSIADSFPVQCGSIMFDANEANPLKNRQDFDVVISALPARYNMNLAEVCIRQGMHFCDLGGVLPVTLGMRGGLDFMARKNGVSVVPDCGLMPGLGVMIARKLVNDSIIAAPESSYRDVLIYVGGLPQKPRPPLYYQKMFSLEGLRHLCYDDAPILNEGRVVFVPPFTGHSFMEVKELAKFSPEDGPRDGTVETFITAGASLAPWSFLRLGVTSLSEMTIRWPGFVATASEIEEADFEDVIGPMIDIPVDAENPDLVWMKVIVSYRGEGDEWSNSHTLFAKYDPVSGLTAMEQTTGFTTALIAQAIARGETMPGVLTPDEALTGDSLNRVIAETGSYFRISEETTP